MKWILTVDTEADDQWAQDGEATLHNLDEIQRLQSFAEERGIPPTYLVSYEALAHPALRTLADAHTRGAAEIGGHLHPWTTPPYDALDTTVQRFPLELPDEVLDAKLHSLTEAIRSLITEQPHSFRAGRWGSDERVLKAVACHGYQVDSSVTPGIAWKRIVKDRAKHMALPDFSDEQARPYHVPGTNLYEVPMSVLPTGILPSERLAAQAHKKGIVAKLARGLTRPRWCRIFPGSTLADLVAVYHAAQRMQLPVLVFMTHSSELAAGRSPYAKDEAAVNRTYELLGGFADFLDREGVRPVRMRDVLPEQQ